MRVLHIQKVKGMGGSERHLLQLLPGLRAEGWEVRMCILAADAFELFDREVAARDLDRVIVSAGRDVNPLLLPSLLTQIRSFRPNLLHTHLIHADLYGQVAARITGVPSLSSIHATHPVFTRQPYKGLATLAGHLAKRTITISHHVKRFVSETGIAPSNSIRVIHYGIDAQGWVLSTAERYEARRELGLSAQDIAVGVASRLIPFKGHDFLIEGFARAAAVNPDLRLLVAGSGPIRDRLQAKARDLCPPEIIRFLGHLPDIRRFMNACDVLTFPTMPGFGEGFGLAALEAMAAARPLIASNIDSLPEIVVQEETGFLVRPGGVQELASALLSLGQDAGLRSRMGNAALERARAHFSLERMVRQTSGVYQELIG